MLQIYLVRRGKTQKSAICSIHLYKYNCHPIIKNKPSKTRFKFRKKNKNAKQKPIARCAVTAQWRHWAVKCAFHCAPALWHAARAQVPRDLNALLLEMCQLGMNTFRVSTSWVVVREKKKGILLFIVIRKTFVSRSGNDTSKKVYVRYIMSLLNYKTVRNFEFYSVNF